LSKAAQSARSVSTEAGYLTEDTKEQVLQKAHGQAQGVASKAKDYSPA
jgi:large subunit ribosomal protein L10